MPNIAITLLQEVSKVVHSWVVFRICERCRIIHHAIKTSWFTSHGLNHHACNMKRKSKGNYFNLKVFKAVEWILHDSLQPLLSMLKLCIGSNPIHLIPKWPPFKYSFVFIQISPWCLVLKLKIQKNILSWTRQQEPICMRINPRPFWNKVNSNSIARNKDKDLTDCHARRESVRIENNIWSHSWFRKR